MELKAAMYWKKRCARGGSGRVLRTRGWVHIWVRYHRWRNAHYCPKPCRPSFTLVSLPERGDVHVARLNQVCMLGVLLEWISEMIMQAIQAGEDCLERVSINGRERRRRG